MNYFTPAPCLCRYTATSIWAQGGTKKSVASLICIVAVLKALSLTKQWLCTQTDQEKHLQSVRSSSILTGKLFGFFSFGLGKSLLGSGITFLHVLCMHESKNLKPVHRKRTWGGEGENNTFAFCFKVHKEGGVEGRQAVCVAYTHMAQLLPSRNARVLCSAQIHGRTRSLLQAGRR